MKHILYNMLMPVAVLCAASCTQDLEYRTGEVSPVSMLIAPENDCYVKLQSTASSTLKFEWAPAYAEDGMTPQYEVVFYGSENGGEPVYRVDAGMNTSVSITHKDLNKAASAAGIPTGEDGTMYWAVVANRGITQSDVTVTPRKIEVTRLLGFETLPSAVYITGEATETGTDLSSACKAFEGEEEGMFVIYHRLTAGKGFTFTSGTGGEYTTYTIKDGVLDDKSTEPATVSEDGIYKITMDFNIKSVTMSLVTDVIYNFSGKHTKDLSYIGNGCWKMTDYTVEFVDEGTWKEDRYHFRAKIGGTEYVWGYVSTDSSNPGDLTGSFYYLYEYVWDNNNWAYPFKFATSLDGSTVDITVKMNGDDGHPTHVIDNIR